jgi:hypothetical protein
MDEWMSGRGFIIIIIIIPPLEIWSPWWNDIDGKIERLEEKPVQCHFIHHRSHWIDPGANPGHHGERPATNCLSHGTAFFTPNYNSIEQDFS